MPPSLLLLPLLLLFAALPSGQAEVAGCEDADAKCPEWASQGECASNAVWMMANCRKSCHSCQGGEKAWKLRTHISQKYNNSTLNSTRVVRVESVRLNSLEIDEEKQTAKATGRLVLSWNDSSVAWDAEQWGLSWLNFYWVQIWSPQIVQINGKDSGSVASKILAANYTGQIYLWTDFSFTTSFEFQYNDYPTDYQQICYKFDDKRLFAVQFTVAPEVESKQREALTETHISGWIIEDLVMKASSASSVALSDWHRNPFDVQSTNGELCVGVERNSVFFLSEMLLPALISSLFTISAVLFKLSKTQCLLLSFSVVCQLLSLLLVANRLPSFFSRTPSILKFASFNMGMTSLLFLSSLLLHRLSTAPSALPPPHSISKAVGFVNALLPLPKVSADEVPHPWGPAAQAANQVLFLASGILYLVAFFTSFII